MAKKNRAKQSSNSNNMPPSRPQAKLPTPIQLISKGEKVDMTRVDPAITDVVRILRDRKREELAHEVEPQTLEEEPLISFDDVYDDKLAVNDSTSKACNKLPSQLLAEELSSIDTKHIAASQPTTSASQTFYAQAPKSTDSSSIPSDCRSAAALLAEMDECAHTFQVDRSRSINGSARDAHAQSHDNIKVSQSTQRKRRDFEPLNISDADWKKMTPSQRWKACKPPPVPKEQKIKPGDELKQIVRPSLSSDGGWERPPPITEFCLTKPDVEWGYRDPLQGKIDEKYVDAWNAHVEHALKHEECVVDLSSYRRALKAAPHIRKQLDFNEEYWSRPITPQYWKPLRMGNQSPAMYWHELTTCRLKPVDDGDLDGVKPWWIEFPPHESPLAQVYHAPDVAGIDSDDENDAQREARENDHGSLAAAKPYFERKRRLAREAKKMKEHILW